MGSIFPGRKTDQDRGIQIIQLLKDIKSDRGNKQVLKNMLGRVFGSVWKTVCYFNLDIFRIRKERKWR